MEFHWFIGRGAALRGRLERSRSALFRLAYMWSHDRALADDLAQEALAKAVERLGQLRDAEKLESWLYGILANCWRDHLRALRPSEDIDAIDEQQGLADAWTPEHAASRSELAARVRLAVAELPIGQREVLALVDLEECSYAEAARILGIPVGTVMSRLSRARSALRDRLAEPPIQQRPPLRSVK